MTYEFIYEYPHDKIHRITGVEVAPNVYTIEILSTQVTIECTPSKKAFYVTFPTGPGTVWEQPGSSIDDVLTQAHKAIVEHTKHVEDGPIVLTIAGIERAFVLDPSFTHTLAWKYKNGPITLYLYHDDYEDPKKAYRVASESDNRLHRLYAQGSGKTPQFAANAWAKQMKFEIDRYTTAVADMTRMFVTS